MFLVFVPQVLGQLGTRNILLFAAGQILHRKLIRLRLVLTDNHDVLRARFLGELERSLQPEACIAKIGANAGSP